MVVLSSQIRAQQHHGIAVGIGNLSEQMLIGGHAETLIIAPADHPNRGGAMPRQVIPVAARRRPSASNSRRLHRAAPHR
jgi:hypothetical protein